MSILTKNPIGVAQYILENRFSILVRSQSSEKEDGKNISTLELYYINDCGYLLCHDKYEIQDEKAFLMFLDFFEEHNYIYKDNLMRDYEELVKMRKNR